MFLIPVTLHQQKQHTGQNLTGPLPAITLAVVYHNVCPVQLTNHMRQQVKALWAILVLQLFKKNFAVTSIFILHVLVNDKILFKINTLILCIKNELFLFILQYTDFFIQFENRITCIIVLRTCVLGLSCSHGNCANPVLYTLVTWAGTCLLHSTSQKYSHTLIRGSDWQGGIKSGKKVQETLLQ